MIACLTSGAISKQKAVRATVEGDANSEFSAALTSLDNFIHKSLKDEQTEYIRRIISLEEAVLPVLTTGFSGKSVITRGPRYVFMIKYLLNIYKTTYRNLKHTEPTVESDSGKGHFKRHRKANKTPHMNR